MKRIVITLIPLLLITACTSEDKKDDEISYDIECKGQVNGWHNATQTVTNAQNRTFVFDGEWHCKNEKLWYSSMTDELNMFGRFYVTTSESEGKTQKFQYNFMQIDKAQNLIATFDGTNVDHNNVIESFDLSLKFLTDDGILKQIMTTSPYSGDSYALEYNANSTLITEFNKTIFKGATDSLFHYDINECEGERNLNWQCAQWDSALDIKQIEQEKITGEETTKIQYLSIDTALLENPLTTRNELMRLGRKLF